MDNRYRAVAAHPTQYGGVLFRSRLEARWAAFFDLVGWKWEYEPVEMRDWLPDFRVVFPCTHSECGGSHTLLVEIKPYYTIEEFCNHRCMDYFMDCDDNIPANSSAAFGNNPHISEWQMVHGAGGGVYRLDDWLGYDVCERYWKEAGNIVQYKPERKNVNDSD